MRPIPKFRRLRKGKDGISATEWNALVGMVENLYRSSMNDGIMDSTGFHPRKRIAPAGGGALRLAYTLASTIDNQGLVLSCSLDEPGGEAVEVKTMFYGGSYFRQLRYAYPILGVNQPVFLMQVEEEWVCISPIFQAAVRY